MGSYYVGILYDKKNISHFGIKGQKWGVRRFQNSDGTWTEAGKKRYGKLNPHYKAAIKDIGKLAAVYGGMALGTVVVTALLEAHGNKKASEVAYNAGRETLRELNWLMPIYAAFRVGIAASEAGDADKLKYSKN